jgi:hypothetical protein
VLRRQDGSFVTAFSASGTTKEGIVEAAREDYGKLLSEGTPQPKSDIEWGLLTNLLEGAFSEFVYKNRELAHLRDA